MARQKKAVASQIEYPYSFIPELYNVQDILRTIPTEDTQADAGTFPSNIQKHYWIVEGENDGDEWKSLGKLKNGNYFFFTAACDYTGFDCQGWMRLWVSKSFQTILDHAMSKEDRRQYSTA